jgi:hypothetical protein
VEVKNRTGPRNIKRAKLGEAGQCVVEKGRQENRKTVSRQLMTGSWM